MKSIALGKKRLDCRKRKNGWQQILSGRECKRVLQGWTLCVTLLKSDKGNEILLSKILLEPLIKLMTSAIKKNADSLSFSAFKGGFYVIGVFH